MQPGAEGCRTVYPRSNSNSRDMTIVFDMKGTFCHGNVDSNLSALGHSLSFQVLQHEGTISHPFRKFHQHLPRLTSFPISNGPFISGSRPFASQSDHEYQGITTIAAFPGRFVLPAPHDRLPGCALDPLEAPFTPGILQFRPVESGKQTSDSYLARMRWSTPAMRRKWLRQVALRPAAMMLGVPIRGGDVYLPQHHQIPVAPEDGGQRDWSA
ncbi:hypothetical protein QBC39DRAFT_411796 [Podospora conica]|nr:hypothetical protein QBC39DRAFT_411796 [Schizothecium conicum]